MRLTVRGSTLRVLAEMTTSHRADRLQRLRRAGADLAVCSLADLLERAG